MTPFYEDPTSFPYIERAVLMEDIKLPIYNEKKKLKHVTGVLEILAV